MVHLSVRPYVRPLAEAMDQSPHYGVAVVEKDALRLFTVNLGEIEEYRRPRIGTVDEIRSIGDVLRRCLTCQYDISSLPTVYNIARVFWDSHFLFLSAQEVAGKHDGKKLPEHW